MTSKSPLRKLAGQTAVYGLSSILGRFLNYLLTPLYTSRLVFDPEQYGIITEMYAYVAFLVVLLTYGMETAFFRFYSDSENRKKSFSTAVVSLLVSSTLFVLFLFLFAQPVAEMLRYPNHKEYVTWFAIIVGLDALCAIPLARLRAENKALRFAGVNFSFIFINIGLNLFFLAYCMPQFKMGNTNWVIDTFYNPEIGVGYVFIANLNSSIARALLLSPLILGHGWRFDKVLWRRMLKYGSPLLIAGLAGIVNETLDRAMLKWLLWDELGELATMTQLGIYGACYKLSIVITVCIQAYRYAAEPFFFNQSKAVDAKLTYARLLNVFVAFVLLAFLTVTLFIDYFKYFIPNEAYWSGLDVVPILLLANIFLGIYYNLSFWYKLTDNTQYGMYLAIGGALITILLNAAFIPEFGFRASAWATLICYATMSIGSLWLGRKHYPIPYNFKRLGIYFFLAGTFWVLSTLLDGASQMLKILYGLIAISGFALAAYWFEIKKKTRIHETQG